MAALIQKSCLWLYLRLGNKGSGPRVETREAENRVVLIHIFVGGRILTVGIVSSLDASIVSYVLTLQKK